MLITSQQTELNILFVQQSAGELWAKDLPTTETQEVPSVWADALNLN